jgi:hypothetical protein
MIVTPDFRLHASNLLVSNHLVKKNQLAPIPGFREHLAIHPMRGPLFESFAIAEIVLNHPVKS